MAGVENYILILWFFALFVVAHENLPIVSDCCIPNIPYYRVWLGLLIFSSIRGSVADSRYTTDNIDNYDISVVINLCT